MLLKVWLVGLMMLITLAPGLAQTSGTKICNPSLGELPILQGGRVKPLQVHADEVLEFISGEKKFGEFSAVEAYCLLSVSSLGIPTPFELQAKVEHLETRKTLDLNQKKKVFPIKQLVPLERDLRIALMQKKQNDGHKKDMNKVLTRIRMYNDIVQGENWKLPSLDEKQKLQWVGVTQYIGTEYQKSQASGMVKPSGNLFLKAKETYIKNVNDDYLLELTYVKINPFSWAMLVSLLGLICFGLFKKSKAAYALAWATIAIQTVGMVMRIYISGRAPITNMYETVMFSGFGALLISLIVGHWKKEDIYLFSGLAYNVLCMLMINFAHSMLDPKISPLVPVLRDNFWLSTHVTCIIMSYAALALSWILANVVLIKKRFMSISNSDFKYYSEKIYTCLKIGVVLLSAGLILGGVWADYSWGRFWGWDPKETWSLIALCIYIAILHGRYTNWINDNRFVSLTALAFLSIMFAWFGVNYILATGLHSYGFSENGAVFLGSFFIIQIAVVVVSEVFPKKASD